MKEKTLYEINSDGTTELWDFPNNVMIQEIRAEFDRYLKSDYENFEEYLEDNNPGLKGQRIFATEIFI